MTKSLLTNKVFRILSTVIQSASSAPGSYYAYHISDVGACHGASPISIMYSISPHTRRDAARQVPTLFSGRTFICIFPKHPLSLRKTLNATDYGIFNRCITQVADRFPKF